MAALQNATVFAEPWGPERWQLFNYYAHPTRDPGAGNPCLIWRTGGGGWSGMVIGFSFADIGAPIADFLLNTTALGVHFDVVVMQTCQQYIDETAQYIPRTTRHNMSDNWLDHQRGVAAIKAWGSGLLNNTTYRIDPNKIITGGHSFGGTVTGLSMIRKPTVFSSAPPGGGLPEAGGNRIWEPGQFDSTTNGVIYYSSQPDFRKRTLTNPGGTPTLRDYLDWTAVGGIFGTPDNSGTDTSANWDAVSDRFKEASSLMWYLENNYTRYARPIFTLYQDEPLTSHPGTYPLISNHDKRMRLDLNNAIAQAGINNALVSAGVPCTGLTPIGPPATGNGTNYSPSVANCLDLYNFMVGCLDLGATRRAQTKEY